MSDNKKEIQKQQQQVAQVTEAEKEVVSQLMLTGNMEALKPEQRVIYYAKMCNHLGLDPVTQPFSILKLSGKVVLYANRGCAQQLNQKHGISHQIVSREKIDGLYVVTAKGILKDGRQTESVGAVNIMNDKGEEYKGETLANCMMKAETKAKRRATLDLVGLGMPDHSEVETIKGANTYSFNPSTGEQKEQLPFFEKQYPEAEILNVLKQCTERPQVVKLYYANQKLIEANPQIKEEFGKYRDYLDGKEANPKDNVEDAEIVEEDKQSEAAKNQTPDAGGDDSDFKI